MQQPPLMLCSDQEDSLPQEPLALFLPFKVRHNCFAEIPAGDFGAFLCAVITDSIRQLRV